MSKPLDQMIAEAVKSAFDESLPKANVVEKCIVEGVRLATLEHLSKVDLKSVTEPPKPAPVKAPPAPAIPPLPVYRPNLPTTLTAPTDPSQIGRLYKVVKAAVQGKDSKQHYLAVTLQHEEGRDKIQMRFRRPPNPTEKEWDELLAKFVFKLKILQINDTDDFLGRTMPFLPPFVRFDTYASLAAIKQKLGEIS